LTLDQDRKISGVLAIPSVKRLENLETVGTRRNLDLDGRPVGRRSLVDVLTWVIAVCWETGTSGFLELEVLAVRVLEAVGERVEVQGTGQGHGDDHVGRSDERVCGRVGVVTTSEVAVVRRDDGVLLTLLDVLAVPLSCFSSLVSCFTQKEVWPTDTGSAGICENHATKVFQHLGLTTGID